MFKSKTFWIVIVVIAAGLFLLSVDYKKNQLPKPVWGASFSVFHSNELKLDWKKVYLAALDDLKIRNFRFSAHWPLTEPAKGVYNFKEMDFQMQEAQKRNASVILAVGRRLPGWPECHVPDWAQKLDKDQQHQEILSYITTVVNRYKNYSNIKYWQVENEPYLTTFSRANCGELDNNFLKEEIALVHKLDPDRKVLVTDSGELGLWYGAYSNGDAFGTSIYLYIWFKPINLPFRWPVWPGFFRTKDNIMSLIYGKKPTLAIEVSAEPWLLQPIADTPIETQLNRMGMDKLQQMVSFSKSTQFDQYYLWGMEWWYWMKEHGHPEMWEWAKTVYSQN